MKKKLLLGIAAFCAAGITAKAQQVPAMCRNTEMMQAVYQAHPEADQQASEKQSAAMNMLARSLSKSTAVDTYRVALVFHVYGTTQGGQTVNNTVIQAAVAKLNEDFHGLNNDYNTVHTLFLPKRSPKNIKFYLAKKDPMGNNTTGITYHPVTAGFGNGSGYDTQIQADAWDNKKYINIYVMNDLYNDGITYNSGVAWYPNTWMTNNNLARIVYNGAYLATNTDPEFASVLTHEFGHFFNLIHTFEGGCTMPNDEVTDTPPCTTAQGCHTTTTINAPLNCNSILLNAENYMDYNSGCYKMFTQGQAARMDTALYFPSRVTLWQDTTNIITGIDTPVNTSVAGVETGNSFQLYPNPTTGVLQVRYEPAGEATVQVTNTVGQVVFTGELKQAHTSIDLSGEAKGIYFVTINETGRKRTQRVMLY